MRIAIILIFMGGFLGGCSYINKKLGLMENMVESALESHFGLPDDSLDLTPEEKHTIRGEGW